MHEKLLLNQARYADADKSNMTLQIDLPGDKDIIVDDHFSEVVNQYNVYLDERQQCSTVRLTAQVNLIASNTLFNSVTEIVKNEGSNNCEYLNVNPVTIKIGASGDIGIIGKPDGYQWGNNISECVMDTQITYDGCPDKDYTYLCGIDIFNNHIMRSKSSFTSFWYHEETISRDGTYNTVAEKLCDVFSYKRRFSYLVFPVFDYDSNYYNDCKWQHRYKKGTLYSFYQSLQLNLKENNGWLGFYNKSQIKSLSVGLLYDGTERVINNVRANRFIDLFPGRDRFSLLPHYNKYRNRYEKNWEYCLTYPSGSDTAHIPFINSKTDTLKIGYIDENGQDDDSVYRCTIYSISKHGLHPDDTINLYRSKDISDESLSDNDTELIEAELVVDDVIDDYVFTVYTTDWVCRKWVSIFDEGQLSANNVTHVAGTLYTCSGNSEVSVNGYLNLDYDGENYIGSKNLSFAKIVNGIPCKYYVRIFSRFPNFDFYDKEVTYENIYSSGGTIDGKTFDVIDEYSTLGNEKQSTLSKLGFSRNAYNDDMCQIVYDDDIDISVIRDNLGRPLTSLYLTFFKTNYGYKDWYYSNKSEQAYKNESVEWSRCFGKLNCGFEYSTYIDTRISKFDSGNVRVMNNVEHVLGLNEDWLYRYDYTPKLGDEADEILYKEQDRFYGDLCMYSPYECIETVIQDCCHRFNTAQRELNDVSKNMFKDVIMTEIQIDDYETVDAPFKIKESSYDTRPTQHPEGYYYHPNYEIPIRSFSQTVSEFKPEMFEAISKSKFKQIYIDVKTANETYYEFGNKVCLYVKSTNDSYEGSIENVLDHNLFRVRLKNDSDVNAVVYASDLFIFKIAENVPDYAEIQPGNACTYRWRELVNNGFESMEGIIPEYPFVNGCFYIHKDINIFLRRQDPYGDFGLSTQDVYFGLPQLYGERNPVEDIYDNGASTANINDAISETESIC